MEENLNYSLNCIIEDAKEQKVEINWTDENGKLLQKVGWEQFNNFCSLFNKNKLF